MSRALSARPRIACGWFVVAALAFAPVVQGQQVGVTTPFQSVGDSFYETTGVNFGFSIPGGRGPGSRVVGYAGNGVLTPNLNFWQGGAASAIPPFGGYDPGANANFGFGRYNRNGGGFSLGLSMGKGSTRTLTSTAPSLVVQNGYGGSLFSGQWSPFVTGFTPVVGGGGPAGIDNAVTRALQSGQLDLAHLGSGESIDRPSGGNIPATESSAPYGDESVDAIVAKRESAKAARQARLEEVIAEGLAHEERGEFREARIAYRKARHECEDREQRKWLEGRLQWLKGR